MTQPAVAILAPSAPPQTAGGVASAHLNIYHCLNNLGCQTHLLSFNEIGASSAGEPGLAHFGAAPWLRSLLAFGVYLYMKFRGSRKQAYQVADIICAIPGILQVNRYLKGLRPEILIIPDHNAPGLFLSRGRTPVVLIVHHIPSRFNSSPLLGDFCPKDVAIAAVIEQRVLKRVDAVVCPSEYMKQVFQETYHFDGEVAVIPNLINESWLDAIPVRDLRVELRLPGDVPVVYIPSAGSLFKGSKYVYEIVRRLAGFYEGPLAFYLSGRIDDELLAELEHVPANARLFMPGQVSHRDNIGYVKSCSFGISPTLIESFGMAILEAGYCNVPMAVFEVGGTGEVIREGENGFLVPLLDIDSLLERAVKMLEEDFCRELRSSTGRSVRERFESARGAGQLLALCKRYIDNPARS